MDFLPIVSKSFNKNDQSDYDNGFQPNIQGNELSQPYCCHWEIQMSFC
jgi:hypothetical protein